MEDYEAALGWRLIDGLKAIKGTTIHGISNPNRAAHRVPTISFTLASQNSKDVASKLVEAGIYNWAGHSYALEPAKRIGVMEQGGVIRLGIAHYNTEEEITKTLQAVEKISLSK